MLYTCAVADTLFPAVGCEVVFLCVVSLFGVAGHTAAVVPMSHSSLPTFLSPWLIANILCPICVRANDNFNICDICPVASAYG